MTQAEFDKLEAEHLARVAQKETVFRELETVDQENEIGLPLLALSDDEIADDLIEYSTVVEGIPREVLLSLIAEWRSDQVAE